MSDFPVRKERLEHLAGVLESGHLEITTALRGLVEARAEIERLVKLQEETRRNAEQCRENWLALLNATEETCQLNAFDRINHLMAEQSAHNEQIERLTRELSEARELLREFRACNGGRQWAECSAVYDSRYSQPEQPQPQWKDAAEHCRKMYSVTPEQPDPTERCPECNGSGYVAVPENDSEDHGRVTGWKTEECDYCRPEPVEYIPWDEHTRPRGVVLFQSAIGERLCWGWIPSGALISDIGFTSWFALLRDWRWSPCDDGENWNRCGVPRG